MVVILRAKACVSKHFEGHEANSLPTSFDNGILMLMVRGGCNELDVVRLKPRAHLGGDEFAVGITMDFVDVSGWKARSGAMIGAEVLKGVNYFGRGDIVEAQKDSVTRMGADDAKIGTEV